MQTETATSSPPSPLRPFSEFREGTDGLLAVMDRTGDTKVIWDRHNEAEVEAARATFDSLRSKGYLAYTVNKDGTTGEVIRAFDPTAEKIILSPPMAGG
jgi:hypothetical protein